MDNITKYLSTTPNLTRSVVGFLVKNDTVVLGLRKKVSLGLGANLISGIGGKVGDNPSIRGESDDEALVREFKEEINIQILQYTKIAELTFLFPDKPKWSQFVLAYIITKWSGAPKETEVIKPITFEINDLPTDKMWADNEYWLPRVLSGEKVKAEFLYNVDNSTIKEKVINNY